MVTSKITVDIKAPAAIFNRIVTPAKKLRVVKMIETEMAPYVPYLSGTLVNSTDVDEKSITYRTPYAEVNYKGEGRNFNKEHHPLATAYWDKAMMAAKGGTISRNAERIIKT